MRSDALRRFHVEPHQVTSNEATRQEIARQVEAYLAGGGKIQSVGSGNNANPAFSPWRITKENPQGIVSGR